MRLVFLALIAAALGAQESPKEAKVSVPGGELRYLYAAAGAGSAPLLFLLPGSVDDPSLQKLFAQWRPMAAARGWNLVMPIVGGASDGAVKAVELLLADAKKRLPGVDENRIYLAGQGASTAEVFYTLSREPDLWAAGLAIQGSPAPAINSFRLFGANTAEAPLLWIAPAAEADMFRQKLSVVEFNYETRPSDVSADGRLRNRQSGVCAMLLDRDDEVRSEETERRIEIVPRHARFRGVAGDRPVWVRPAGRRPGSLGRLAARAVSGPSEAE
jgi:poly(3-hydroxybutyrate) depolymerase